jgi:hypothetical protein
MDTPQGPYKCPALRDRYFGTSIFLSVLRLDLDLIPYNIRTVHTVATADQLVSILDPLQVA